MACFSPLSAFQTDDGAIVFAERGSIRRALSLPCGQCIGCRLERSRQWAVRCMHECQMHDASSFVTLTYSPEFVPEDGSLRYRDFQLFMKRLRKEFPGCRFYMCGEYGGDFGRPHFHACLFGVFFKDRVFWKSLPSGFDLYTSVLLGKLWPFGFVSVGDVTFESAAYVARYVMKKVTGNAADEHYKFVDDNGEVFWREPEFNHMSLKPGIGRLWFDKFMSDVFPRDYVLVRGLKVKPPKYYDKLLALDSSFLSDDVEYERYKKSLAVVDDNTPERLRVREIVTRARLEFKKRILS